MRKLFFISIGFILLFACSQESGEQKKPAANVQQKAATQSSGVTWSVPEGWQEEPPSSSMRKAQFRLARAEGDPEDASVVIFYFRGQGGSVQANIERWYGQFKQPDGKPTAETAKIKQQTANDLKQTLVEISGTYLFKANMMASKATEKPNYKMLGGIVEAPNGPWFVKMVGPAKTMDKWRDSFYAFMQSFRQASAS